MSLPVRVHVQEQVKRAELQFQSLPQNHQNLLPNVLSHLAQISKCAEKNQELLQAIVHNSLHMFENTEYGQRVSPQIYTSQKFSLPDQLILTMSLCDFSWSYGRFGPRPRSTWIS